MKRERSGRQEEDGGKEALVMEKGTCPVQLLLLPRELECGEMK